jgi:DNA ligase (NAD+)
MYSQEQTAFLQDATLRLMEKKIDVADLRMMRDILRFHEYRYYVLANPLITDSEYDILYKALQEIETNNSDLITPDSPTQRVGSSLNGEFETVAHLVPMLSLDNSYDAEDLQNFDRRVRELTSQTDIEYTAEPKFDGASISLIYENDLLVRAVTRGDGVAGEDITQNIRQVRSIPLSAPFSEYGLQLVEIRGEVLMTKKAFEGYNEALIRQGLPPLANPRNAASGSLRQKNPKAVAERNLDAFLYHISYYLATPGKYLSPLLQTHSGMLQLLWNCGFRSPVREMKSLSNISEVSNFVTSFESMRDNLPYEIDGMVVKVNSLPLQDQMGMTSHHPRWAIAYKFKARQATTQLLSVEFQVGRTGAVTPVAKLSPVNIGGVNVSSISIHNEDYIREKNLMLGDFVMVERAGDVIPQIVKALPEIRNGNESAIVFPSQCPVCDSSLFKETDEAVWRCVNIECKAQVVEKIIHFVSKDAMDVKNLGEANIKKFFEQGILWDIPGIYKIDYNTLSSWEGFGDKSLEKLRLAIEASKQQPLHRLIYGLGIRYVGETTAKTLAGAVGSLFDLAQLSMDELQKLDDIGIKVAGSIFNFFQNKRNLDMLTELKNLGLQYQGKRKNTEMNSGFSGQNFLFTGTLPTLKRSDAEALVESKGGKIATGVSSKLNFLVVGADAGSKLEKAKKIATIHILSEQEFLDLFANS